MSASCSGLLEFSADLGSLGAGSFCSFDPELRANIWQGNSAEILLHLYIGGVAVSNLSTAISGRFMALGHRDNAIGVMKDYPGDFTIDDPTDGTVRILLTAAETDVLIGEYDLAVQFVWADKTYEWVFHKTLNVMRDQIMFVD